MMTNGWRTVPLGEFLTQRKGFFTIDDFRRYKRARVQLHGRGIVLRDEVDDAEVKTKEQQAARTGEFLVAEIDAKVGGFGIVPPELDGAIVSSHYFLFEINEQKCLREWLDWFIRSGMLEDQVAARGSTNYSAIRPSHVLKFEIPLPPLTEQRRIVARIEALAARVTEAQSLRSGAEDEADAFLYSALNFVFSTLSFPRKTIGELCDTTSGGTPSRSCADFFEGDISWIKSGELEDGFIHRAEEHITEEAIASSSAKIFPKGTLVVALYGATVGKTGVLEIDAATNQAVCALFPKGEIFRDYLWWFLRSKRPVYLKSSFGGAQPNISQKVIRETEIPVPPLEEQRRLVAYLDGLQAQVSALRVAQAETGKELSALMPSILDKAFKGDL